MYSSGMRVSEVIHLHYEDISRTNMQIHIRDTKNRMDRYTIPVSYTHLNLTKMHGAGCTAHEWCHALDHQLAIFYGIEDSFFASASKEWNKLPEVLRKLFQAMKTDSNNGKRCV